jgi:quercetin dioxygenase-like cupin family protein
VIVDGTALEFGRLPGRRSADPFRDRPLEGVSVRIVRVDRDSPRSPHRHPRSYEVMYVLSGSGDLWEDGRFHRVTAGACIAVPPGVPHATVPDAGTEMELVCFFPTGDLASNIEELEEPADLRALREGSR